MLILLGKRAGFANTETHRTRRRERELSGEADDEVEVQLEGWIRARLHRWITEKGFGFVRCSRERLAKEFKDVEGGDLAGEAQIFVHATCVRNHSQVLQGSTVFVKIVRDRARDGWRASELLDAEQFIVHKRQLTAACAATRAAKVAKEAALASE